MKKNVLLLLLFFSFTTIVFADDIPLKKDKEVAKIEITDELWLTPDRVLYNSDNNYFIYDLIYTNTISIPPENYHFEGLFSQYYTFYEKNWQMISEQHSSKTKQYYSNFNFKDYKYSFIVNNNIYSFFDNDGLKLSVYDENFQYEDYNLNFIDAEEYRGFTIVDIKVDDEIKYILLVDLYDDIFKEIRLYDNNTKYESFELNELDMKTRFPEYYYEYLSNKSEFFIIDNDIYSFYFDHGLKMTVYKDDFNYDIYNIDFCINDCGNYRVNEVQINDNIIYILLDAPSSTYKEIKVSNSDGKYDILDLSESEAKEKFPNYFKDGLKNIINDAYFSYTDNSVLISDEMLVYIENGREKFRINDEKYKSYGRAHRYNNLIIAIGYKGDGSKSDILFFDLDGNLLDTYEHNSYDLDLLFDNNQLIVATLYVDGICDIKDEGYYSYNHNCSGVLMNELYDLGDKYLGMALGGSAKEDIVNPDTLPDLNKIVILCFAFSIVITTFLLIQQRVKRYENS